jgi:excisionase family DNA binding protein
VNITSEQLKEVIKEALKESKTDENKLTLTIDEANKLSGIGRDKILELVHNPNSDFPYFKNGSKFLINRDKLVQWIEKITYEKRTI